MPETRQDFQTPKDVNSINNVTVDGIAIGITCITGGIVLCNNKKSVRYRGL